MPNTRRYLHVSFWISQTLLDLGSQSITMRNLYNYTVDIGCIHEVHLLDSAQDVPKFLTAMDITGSFKVDYITN